MSVDLVIGDQMGQATLESCAEADALAPGVASVAPRAKTTGALVDATFIAPGGHETATAEGMVFHLREEPQRAQSAYPRRCATWCGLPFGDKRVPVNFAFSATKAFTLESPAYCCPQRPEDMGL